MNSKHIKSNLLLGFISWLVPYGFSFLFYRSGGELVVDYDLFKSIMIVVATATGCFLLYKYFKNIQSDFVKHGVIVGLSWFAINIVLDVFLLLPFMKVSFADYFASIGLRYIMIPLLSGTMASLLQRKIQQS